MGRWQRRIGHCSGCWRWMVQGDGKGELWLERAKSVAPSAPRGQRRLRNLAVNPTQGSRDEKAAWESFRDTKCRGKTTGPVVVSCPV